jgi:hypothetical protein
MATVITKQTPLAPFATVTAGTLHYTMAAGDVTGSTFTGTGRELLLIFNPVGGSTYTVTISGVVDEKNRSGAITTYSMTAGSFVVWTGGLTNSPGWKDSSTGLITVTVSNAAVLLAVLVIPAGYPG